MEVKLYIGNLSGSTTRDDLTALFARAGEVIATEVMKDRKNGVSRGYAFLTMSAQSEADQAVSMFHAYSFSDQELKVSLAEPGEKRGATSQLFEP